MFPLLDAPYSMDVELTLENLSRGYLGGHMLGVCVCVCVCVCVSSTRCNTYSMDVELSLENFIWGYLGGHMLCVCVCVCACVRVCVCFLY